MQAHAHFSRRTQTFSPEPECSSSLGGLKSNPSSLDAWHVVHGKFSHFVIPVLKSLYCQS